MQTDKQNRNSFFFLWVPNSKHLDLFLIWNHILVPNPIMDTPVMTFGQVCDITLWQQFDLDPKHDNATVLAVK